jgi:hypothetical protein
MRFDFRNGETGLYDRLGREADLSRKFVGVPLLASDV